MSIVVESAIESAVDAVGVTGATLLQSRLLAAAGSVRHGVTRRVAGLGRAEGNVGYGAPRDIEDAWMMRLFWSDAAGIDASTLVTIRQIHGADVALARPGDAGRGAAPGSEPLGYADALIANEPGVSLLTLHADCLAVLLYDPASRSIAAIHAGWRGTVAMITPATIRAMVNTFGARPETMLAYLGPTNRVCCYDVGSDVIEAWSAVDPTDEAGAVESARDRWRFDVAGANRWSLLREGVAAERIEDSGICTKCEERHWFSHRAHGAHTGRFGAMIALDEES